MASPKDYARTRAWIITSTPELSHLLSNTEFVNDHLQKLDAFRDCLVLYAPSEDDTIYCYGLNGLVKLSDADYPQQFNSMDCEFVGDDDGLVCLLFNLEHLAVCNPILKKWTIPANIALLDIPNTTTNEFESNDIITCYGFGKVDGDYRILRLSEWGEHQENNKVREFGLYSLSSASWSVQQRKVSDSNNLLHLCEGPCVEGWVNFRCWHYAPDSMMFRLSTVIFAVNLSDVSERELKLPPSCSLKLDAHFWLCRLHDLLGLVDTVDVKAIKVWGMREYGNSASWQVMFNLPSGEWGSPKGYLPDRNELIMVEDRYEDGYGVVYVYLYDTNNVRKLERKIKGCELPSGIDTCMASLVSPPKGE